MKCLARYCCVLLLFALSSGLAAQAKQLAVVVDKSNSSSGMTLAELTKTLKLDNRKWPDGKTVVLVLRDISAPETQTAIQKIYKMQTEEFKSFLAAHKTAVKIVGSEEDLLKAVAGTPGAIGLVDVYSITSGVNVLKVDGKLPLEQGYFLRGN
jgi:ABC-type phosphate transport system substrate-binding protein